VPAGKIAVNLNYDGLLPFPAAGAFTMIGYERTTLKPLVEELAREFNVELAPDPAPEQGYYYRSDHFSLAKAGVPAFSLDFAAADEEAEQAYREERYHQPADEYDPSWDFSGIAKVAEFGFELG